MPDPDYDNNDEGGDPTADLRQKNLSGTTPSDAASAGAAGDEAMSDEDDRTSAADEVLDDEEFGAEDDDAQGSGRLTKGGQGIDPSSTRLSGGQGRPDKPGGDFGNSGQPRDVSDEQAVRNQGSASSDDYPDTGVGEGPLGGERARDE